MSSHQNSGSKPALLELLTRSGSAGCSHKRDRVYSILGLAKEGPNIEVNFQLQDAWIVYDTLIACESRYCMCMVVYLATQVFELHAMTQEEKYDNGPYVEFMIGYQQFSSYPDDFPYFIALMGGAIGLEDSIRDEHASSSVSPRGMSWKRVERRSNAVIVRLALFAIPHLTF